MTHPDELLAEYVDGALSGEDLRAVERHLAGCDRCRTEVALSGSARTALASLVEPAVPAAVGAAAIEEAERTMGTGRRVTPIRERVRAAPVWYRWAGAAAAAAALVLAVLVLPKLGNGPGGGTPERGVAPAASSSVKAADALEIEHRNYTSADVVALALSYRSATPVPAEPTAGEADTSRSAAAFSAITPDALTCLSTTVPKTGGQLVRLIQARFEGTPAYIGVYLEGPGAGQPPDTVRVWVVAKSDCRILTATRATI